jgi:hypothetical protein
MTLEAQEIERRQPVNGSGNLPGPGTFFLVFPGTTLERSESRLGAFKNSAFAADKSL